METLFRDRLALMLEQSFGILSEDLFDVLVFVGSEAVRSDDVGSNRGLHYWIIGS